MTNAARPLAEERVVASVGVIRCAGYHVHDAFVSGGGADALRNVSAIARASEGGFPTGLKEPKACTMTVMEQARARPRLPQRGIGPDNPR